MITSITNSHIFLCSYYFPLKFWANNNYSKTKHFLLKLKYLQLQEYILICTYKWIKVFLNLSRRVNVKSGWHWVMEIFYLSWMLMQAWYDTPCINIVAFKWLLPVFYTSFLQSRSTIFHAHNTCTNFDKVLLSFILGTYCHFTQSIHNILIKHLFRKKSKTQRRRKKSMFRSLKDVPELHLCILQLLGARYAPTEPETQCSLKRKKYKWQSMKKTNISLVSKHF